MKLPRLARFVALPLLGSVAVYIVLTFPLILQFNAAYFCDDGDGPQTIWDIWWLRHAVIDLHRSIFFTPLLHWPVGASLWLHSLSPMTGLLGIPLSFLFNPIHTYNVLIIFCFAGAAVTAFWLAFDQTRAYWPSLAAGMIYSFCANHFAHAPGHLHQTNTVFLPLFVLLFLRLLRMPTAWRGVFAALTLTAVLLCDHYQFIYAVAVAGLFAVVHLAARRNRPPSPCLPRALSSRTRGEGGNVHHYMLAAIAFIFTSLITTAPLLLHMARDAAAPQAGVHDPDLFSADLLSLFVPGRVWQFHDLTRPIWEAIGRYSEKSVSIGIAALIAAAFARRRHHFSPATWWALAFIFALFALGPTLRIDDQIVTTIMPYRLLDRLPLFALSGCPARMTLVVQLAFSVLAAAGLARLGSIAVIRSSRGRTLIALTFGLALVIESQPRVQPFFPAEPPSWTLAIRDLPIHGAIIDLRTADTSQQLYAQTIHGRPMAFGYLARVSNSVKDDDDQIRAALLKHRYNDLAAMGFGAIVDSPNNSPLPLTVMYDRVAKIYALPAVPMTARPTRAAAAE